MVKIEMQKRSNSCIPTGSFEGKSPRKKLATLAVLDRKVGFSGSFCVVFIKIKLIPAVEGMSVNEKFARYSESG